MVRGRPWAQKSGGEQAEASTSGRVGPLLAVRIPSSPSDSFPPCRRNCGKIYDARNSLERKGEREIESQHRVICGLSRA